MSTKSFSKKQYFFSKNSAISFINCDVTSPGSQASLLSEIGIGGSKRGGGGRRGVMEGRQGRVPLGSKFFRFHSVFGKEKLQNNRLAHPL